ncbi:hypothetical protein FWH30_01805 [Microgenomates group bacterium]|nr:hypothetical protein [Microgenomates group bacterium]
MNKIITSTALALVMLVMSAQNIFADDSRITTEVKRHCTTNSYGQETCTEEKTEIEEKERVIVKETPAGIVKTTIVEHETYDTSMTDAQNIVLMVLMAIAFGFSALQYRKA